MLSVCKISSTGGGSARKPGSSARRDGSVGKRRGTWRRGYDTQRSNGERCALPGGCPRHQVRSSPTSQSHSPRKWRSPNRPRQPPPDRSRMPPQATQEERGKTPNEPWKMMRLSSSRVVGDRADASVFILLRRNTCSALQLCGDSCCAHSALFRRLRYNRCAPPMVFDS